MTKKEFTREVLNKGRNCTQKALECAIGYFVDRDETEQWHVSSCIGWAGRINLSYPEKLISEEDSAQRLAPMTPDILVRSDSLVDIIKPSIELIRQNLLDNSAPPLPFASYDEACEWIVATAHAEQRRSLEARIKYNELGREISEKISDYARKTNALCTTNFRSSVDLWVAPLDAGKRRETRVVIGEQSVLANLAEDALSLAKATGFSQLSVIAYILADIPPLLPPARVRIIWQNNSLGIKRTEVHIELHSPNVPDTQMREIHRIIRQAYGAKHKKSMTDRDQQILEIVERLGGIPASNKSKFWEKVRQEWNERESQKKAPKLHHTWQSARMKHERTLKKIQAISPSNTVPSPHALEINEHEYFSRVSWWTTSEEYVILPDVKEALENIPIRS